MLSCLVGLWAAATAGQAAPEAAWLRSVPADVPVVARVRALHDVRGDLLAMLKAMSPSAEEAVRGGIEQNMQAFGASFGEPAARHPFLVMMRLPDPARPTSPAWGVIVQADDYAAVLKSLGQDGAEAPRPTDGVDSFPGKFGLALYATKGAGWVAFGPDEALIRAVRKPQASLDERLSAEIKARLLAGDLGLYLDIAAVQTQYGEAFEQFKPMILAQIEQAQAPDDPQAARSLEGAKAMIEGLTRLLKVGEGLALSVELDASALALSSLATVRPDSSAAEGLAKARTGTGALMARLPGDLMIYLFADTPPGSGPNLPRAPAPGLEPKTSPEVDRAVAKRMQALDGRLVMGMSFAPMRVVGLADPKDPEAAVRASREASQARQALNDKADASKVEPDALNHGGFRLDRVTTKIDPKVVAAARPDVPNFAQIFGKMLPGDALSEYTGTDGQLFLTAVAPSDDQVKAQIEAIQDASRSLGGVAAWPALRAKLPRRATVLVAMNAQEVVKMLLSVMAAASGKAGLKPPADLPEAPALMGFALVASRRGYDVRLIIPSDVGPVFEKGLAPLGGIE